MYAGILHFTSAAEATNMRSMAVGNRGTLRRDLASALIFGLDEQGLGAYA